MILPISTTPLPPRRSGYLFPAQRLIYCVPYACMICGLPPVRTLFNKTEASVGASTIVAMQVMTERAVMEAY